MGSFGHKDHKYLVFSIPFVWGIAGILPGGGDGDENIVDKVFHQVYLDVVSVAAGGGCSTDSAWPEMAVFKAPYAQLASRPIETGV
ncbi:hypothetical protein PHYBLDRAFT_151824 [Phycomyces blakesleeanus NRRL 1555(-)]|uniref:Uncharacterized protein n=1 Tax=Phycomyces blakesleeanus (strain ATCC 8743b / DSM 1359 / FGSC 10004 / NBRC 33097 / NRRL 1555) TaxID=763407 RepID=A0A167K3Q4_PHYB8|nr:hypothetical protein PHYBLDRAFT_151824 [Phycomyces blakesleeanus NRRL 1555(-)]OAD67216.1 hypothetical protein PHYBLDRAFT_151824 [Phycomyces blakesleeanus NRRL 1555(-)]|eukprot:XP_018285256.1 hypothetical protein PHYBLDRAFT_151824 [Phycomyces blakesleeanus NRRL 1555(-)]